MKNMSRFTKYFAFAFVAATMATSTFAQQMSESVAKVIRIKGSARYADASNVWKPLKVGAVLKSGMIVQTAADSRVDVVLGEKDATVNRVDWGQTSSYGGPGASGGGGGDSHSQRDFIRIQENSVLAFEKLLLADTGTDKIREIELDLRSGKAFGMVKKLNGGSKYEVKIPNAVAGIRGTIYTVNANGQMDVLVGSVVVAYKDAGGNIVTQVVSGGQRFDASTGQITNIPDFDQKEMVKATKEQTGPNVGATLYAYDGTTYWVSPTQGHNGNAGGNGGGGPP
jgi:hypothetical protein